MPTFTLIPQAPILHVGIGIVLGAIIFLSFFHPKAGILAVSLLGMFYVTFYRAMQTGKRPDRK